MNAFMYAFMPIRMYVCIYVPSPSCMHILYMRSKVTFPSKQFSKFSFNLRVLQDVYDERYHLRHQQNKFIGVRSIGASSKGMLLKVC